MGYTILVVDDSKTVRAMVKKCLGLSGVELSQTHEAADGAEALAVLKAQWIDVVFADVHMPRMTGIELVEAMSKDELLGTVPVVIVSSDRNQAHLDRLRRLGIAAYIKKPFRPEHFREVVERVLGGEPGGADG